MVLACDTLTRLCELLTQLCVLEFRLVLLARIPVLVELLYELHVTSRSRSDLLCLVELCGQIELPFRADVDVKFETLLDLADNVLFELEQLHELHGLLDFKFGRFVTQLHVLELQLELQFLLVLQVQVELQFLHELLQTLFELQFLQVVLHVPLPSELQFLHVVLQGLLQLQRLFVHVRLSRLLEECLLLQGAFVLLQD